MDLMDLILSNKLFSPSEAAGILSDARGLFPLPKGYVRQCSDIRTPRWAFNSLNSFIALTIYKPKDNMRRYCHPTFLENFTFIRDLQFSDAVMLDSIYVKNECNLPESLLTIHDQYSGEVGKGTFNVRWIGSKMHIGWKFSEPIYLIANKRYNVIIDKVRVITDNVETKFNKHFRETLTRVTGFSSNNHIEILACPIVGDI